MSLESGKDFYLEDTIEVELNDGEKFIGKYDVHPLAGECVLNKYGFPIQFKKVLSVFEKGRFNPNK